MQNGYISPDSSRMNPSSVAPQDTWAHNDTILYTESVGAAYLYVAGITAGVVAQLVIYVDVAAASSKQVA